MTRLILVRHAAHDWLGRGICGRMPGVNLNTQGLAQAEELALKLKVQVDAIWSSPQQRALQTAGPLAERLKLPVLIAYEFDEVDFGRWTGRSMAELEAQGAPWRHWVDRRSTAVPPGGEPFANVAARTLAGAERLARRYRGKCVVVFSHGDVIKSLVASCLGLSLDHLERFEIAPASACLLVTQEAQWQVKVVNQALTGPVLPP